MNHHPTPPTLLDYEPQTSARDSKVDKDSRRHAIFPQEATCKQLYSL
jgi:hypothetical protein